MNELSAKYHDVGLEIVTINVDKDRKAADRFLADLKTSLPVVYDPKGELAKFYELKVMPTSFVYGRGGKLEERHEGFQPTDGPVLDSLIASLLKEAAPK
jgi:thiol-disulfide isomerase/thioredoxin